MSPPIRQRPEWADELLDLAVQEATGRLVVASPVGEFGWVWLRDGQLSGASAATRRPLLSRRLIAFEILTEDFITEALESIRLQPGQRLLDIVIQDRLAPAPFIDMYLRHVMAEQLGFMMAADVSEISFEAGRVQRVSPLLLPVPEVLMAGLTTPFRIPDDIADQAMTAAVTDFTDSFAIQRSVLCASNGRRTPEQVADHCGLTTSEILQIIADLERRGTLQLSISDGAWRHEFGVIATADDAHMLTAGTDPSRVHRLVLESGRATPAPADARATAVAPQQYAAPPPRPPAPPPPASAGQPVPVRAPHAPAAHVPPHQARPQRPPGPQPGPPPAPAPHARAAASRMAPPTTPMAAPPRSAPPPTPAPAPVASERVAAPAVATAPSQPPAQVTEPLAPGRAAEPPPREAPKARAATAAPVRAVPVVRHAAPPPPAPVTARVVPAESPVGPRPSPAGNGTPPPAQPARDATEGHAVRTPEVVADGRRSGGEAGRPERQEASPGDRSAHTPQADDAVPPKGDRRPAADARATDDHDARPQPEQRTAPSQPVPAQAAASQPAEEPAFGPGGNRTADRAAPAAGPQAPPPVSTDAAPAAEIPGGRAVAAAAEKDAAPEKPDGGEAEAPAAPGAGARPRTADLPQAAEEPAGAVKAPDAAPAGSAKAADPGDAAAPGTPRGKQPAPGEPGEAAEDARPSPPARTQETAASPQDEGEALAMFAAVEEVAAGTPELPPTEPQAEVTTTSRGPVWQARPRKPSNPMQTSDVFRELQSLGTEEEEAPQAAPTVARKRESEGKEKKRRLFGR